MREGGEEGREEGGGVGGRGGREGGREKGRQKGSERGRERVTHRKREREGGRRSREHSVRGYPQEGIYHWPMNLLARIRHAIRQQLFNRSIFVFDQ